MVNTNSIKNKEIVDKDISVIELKDIYGRDRISFHCCIIHVFPSPASILHHFPYLTSICITLSTLPAIKKEDFSDLGCLRSLIVKGCNLFYLPGDLFEHTQNLRFINMSDNKIKYIDGDILKPLRDLWLFDLRGNSNIDAKYYNLNVRLRGYNLAAFKKQIEKCKPDVLNMLETINTHEENIQLLSMKCCEQEKLVATSIELKKKLEELEGEFDYQRAQVEITKDFTVKIGSAEIKVHKAILIAKSRVLAYAIAKQPRANHLELKEISASAFQHVVCFMYTGHVLEKADLVELYAASCRFEIIELSRITTSMIETHINRNPFEILISCNKHSHDKFKMKAFEKFKENFPGQELKVELASRPEKLKALMRIKLEMEKAIAAANSD